MKSKSEKRSPLKDKPLRYAGQSLDEQIEDKALSILQWFLSWSFMFILTFNEWFRYLRPTAPRPGLITILTLVVTGIGVYKTIVALKEITRLKMARDGEKLVGEGLQEMIKHGATVINDLRGDSFNIDHVVVSKNGIYLIETKTFSKPAKKEAKISFNDENVFADGVKVDRNPIHQAKALAKWLHDLLIKSTGLKFNVRPVILFPGWFVEPMKRGQEVWILNPKALPTFISNEPMSIKDSDVYMVAFHLSRYVRTFIPKEGK